VKVNLEGVEIAGDDNDFSLPIVIGGIIELSVDGDCGEEG
jgi:hypothetical protein